MSATSRIDGVVKLFGIDFDVGSDTRRGVFALVTRGFVRSLLSPPEVESLTPPYRVCLVPATDPTQVGDTVVVGGEALTVGRVVPFRHRGTVVGRALVFGPSP